MNIFIQPVMILVLLVFMNGAGALALKDPEVKNKLEIKVKKEIDKNAQYKEGRIQKDKEIREDRLIRKMKLKKQVEPAGEEPLKTMGGPELEAQIGLLKDKIANEEDAERRARLKDRLRLLLERRKHRPPPEFVPSPPLIAPHPGPGPRPPHRIEPLPPVEFGLAGGIAAATPAVLGEVKFNNPFDLIQTSLRLGGLYAQGEDSAKVTRKYVLAVIDLIYRLNPPETRGINSYFGFGANYVAYTSGRKSGTTGGQIFYGLEGDTGAGKFYLEAGYGLFRTGFSPDSQGANIVLGFRM